jgi:hypothetical protein
MLLGEEGRAEIMRSPAIISEPDRTGVEDAVPLILFLAGRLLRGEQSPASEDELTLGMEIGTVKLELRARLFATRSR